MARVIGYVKSLEQGTFFVKDAKGSVHQLKIGEAIHEGEVVYGSPNNPKDAKIIVDISVEGMSDILIAGNEALNFDTSLLQGVFSDEEAVLSVASVKRALVLNGFELPATDDTTNAGDETAAGNSVTDQERPGSDIFSDRTGLVADVSTLLNSKGANVPDTAADTTVFRPVLLETEIIPEIPTDNLPVISTGSGSVVEATQPSISGDLSATDADNASLAFSAATLNGTYGSLVVDAAGVWTYTLNSAADALSAGQTESETFTVSLNDGSTTTVAIHITGTDNAPTIVSSYTSLTSSQEKIGTDYGDLMSRDFPTLHEGQALSSAQQIDVGEIVMQATQDISVKFISEGAGYKSSFGWYTIAENGTIGNMQIIWDNASATGSGGSLVPNSSTAILGSISEGTKIGFFLVSDGYTDGVRAGQTLSAINSSTGNPATIYDQETPKLYADGTWINNQSTSDMGQIYFLSYSNLNSDDRVHAVGGRGSSDGMLRIGFEDLYSGGDQDFEDIVFEINLGTATMKSLASGWLGDVEISDPDSANLTSSSVSITANYHSGDILKLDPMYSIDGNGNVLLNGTDTGINSSGFNSITGILNFTGTASISTYSELLSSINFQTDSGINGTREIQFSGIDDQGNESNFNLIEYSITAPAGTTLNGGSGNDTLNGTQGDDTIYGNNGDDTLNGNNGNDILVGGSGADKLFGGFGNDTLITDLVAARTNGNNVLTGDNIVNSIDGGSGIDTLIFTGNININFSALSSNNNPIANIEIIDLSQGNHQLTNLSLSDVIDMTDSNHTLTIVGESSDSVNVPQVSGNYSVAKVTDAGFDIYTYHSSNASDPTVTVKIEQDVTHS